MTDAYKVLYSAKEEPHLHCFYTSRSTFSDAVVTLNILWTALTGSEFNKNINTAWIEHNGKRCPSSVRKRE